MTDDTSAGSVRGVDPAAEEAIAGAAASLARAIESAVERQWRQWFPDMPPAVADVPAGIRAWHAALGRAGGWPDPPYYAEDMARLLRDAAEQAPFRIQGGPDYCNGLRRAAALVEEFGVAAPAVPEGRADGRAEEVWLPGMLATIWWAVDGGPIGVNHAMRRDDDWVACGDVAVPDQFVIKAERIVLPDPQPLPDGLNDINPSRNGDFTAPVVGEREERPSAPRSVQSAAQSEAEARLDRYRRASASECMALADAEVAAAVAAVRADLAAKVEAEAYRRRDATEGADPGVPVWVLALVRGDS